MKWSLLLLPFLFACSKKYYDYDYINKNEFTMVEVDRQNLPEEEAPLLIPGKTEVEEFCAGQILFKSNAFNIAHSSIPAIVNQSCPGDDFLVRAQITQSWWTTLLYTRSCVTIKSFCPKKL